MYDPRSKEVFFTISYRPKQNTCSVELEQFVHTPLRGYTFWGGVGLLRLLGEYLGPPGVVDNSLPYTERSEPNRFLIARVAGGQRNRSSRCVCIIRSHEVRTTTRTTRH